MTPPDEFKTALNKLRPKGSYSDQDQALFLRGVQGAAAHYRKRLLEPKWDRDLASHKMERFADATKSLAAAYETLGAVEAEIFADLYSTSMNRTNWLPFTNVFQLPLANLFPLPPTMPVSCRWPTHFREICWQSESHCRMKS